MHAHLLPKEAVRRILTCCIDLNVLATLTGEPQFLRDWLRFRKESICTAYLKTGGSQGHPSAKEKQFLLFFRYIYVMTSPGKCFFYKFITLGKE